MDTVLNESKFPGLSQDCSVEKGDTVLLAQDQNDIYDGRGNFNLSFKNLSLIS